MKEKKKFRLFDAVLMAVVVILVVVGSTSCCNRLFAIFLVGFIVDIIFLTLRINIS